MIKKLWKKYKSKFRIFSRITLLCGGRHHFLPDSAHICKYCAVYQNSAKNSAESQNLVGLGLISINYHILPNKRASPNRSAPPQFLDHIPEDSRPKIYMTTQFNDRFNAVSTICLLHPMK